MQVEPGMTSQHLVEGRKSVPGIILGGLERDTVGDNTIWRDCTGFAKPGFQLWRFRLYCGCQFACWAADWLALAKGNLDVLFQMRWFPEGHVGLAPRFCQCACNVPAVWVLAIAGQCDSDGQVLHARQSMREVPKV